MLRTILLVLLILIILGSLPLWPYSGGWGYCPVGRIADWLDRHRRLLSEESGQFKNFV